MVSPLQQNRTAVGQIAQPRQRLLPGPADSTSELTVNVCSPQPLFRRMTHSAPSPRQMPVRMVIQAAKTRR
jgi:hypothetical protein